MTSPSDLYPRRLLAFCWLECCPTPWGLEFRGRSLVIGVAFDSFWVWGGRTCDLAPNPEPFSKRFRSLLGMAGIQALPLCWRTRRPGTPPGRWMHKGRPWQGEGTRKGTLGPGLRSPPHLEPSLGHKALTGRDRARPKSKTKAGAAAGRWRWVGDFNSTRDF